MKAPGHAGSAEDAYTSEIVAQLLQEMDGIKSSEAQILVIGATNHVGTIDAAILSRFTRQIEIPLPSSDERRKLFYLELEGKKVATDTNKLLDKLVAASDGLSRRDIRNTIDAATQSAFEHACWRGEPENVWIAARHFALLNPNDETATT